MYILYYIVWACMHDALMLYNCCAQYSPTVNLMMKLPLPHPGVGFWNQQGSKSGTGTYHTLLYVHGCSSLWADTVCGCIWRYTCTLFPKADVGCMHWYQVQSSQVNHLQIFVKATKGKGVESIPMQAPSSFRRLFREKRHIKEVVYLGTKTGIPM